MAYKGVHRNNPQAAQKRADAAKPAKQDVYTVHGIPVVPVRFTGFSPYRVDPANTTTSAN
jgi:hypothetical protein